MDTGRAALRLTVGPLFIGHGTQKLFGWFGGGGIEQTGKSFEQLGMYPGRRHATAAGAAEAVGGAMIAFGFLTPVATMILSGVMTTAIRKVHAKNGVWASGGGFEYNIVLMAALAALVEQGPGHPSFDATVLPRFKGPGLVLLSVGAGAAGSWLNERLFNEAPPAQPLKAVTTDTETSTDGAQ
jgi:putative oxidoreductase